MTTPPPSWIERVSEKHYWDLQIRKWRLQGKLDPAVLSLSVGGRWITEVLYFREIVGLRNHIGIDLHSDDEDLVVIGDMHDMPFPDNHSG